MTTHVFRQCCEEPVFPASVNGYLPNSFIAPGIELLFQITSSDHLDQLLCEIEQAIKIVSANGRKVDRKSDEREDDDPKKGFHRFLSCSHTQDRDTATDEHGLAQI